MTDADLFEFQRVFRELTLIFPLRGDADELRDVGGAYFRSMRRFSLDQVRHGKDRCVERCKKFPRPAEWVDLIPRAGVPMEIRELDALARSEWLAAEQKYREDDPCGCAKCREAGVSDKQIRFVPTLDRDGQTQQGKIGERIIVLGHWAHGFELARYYQARADFYDAYLARFPMTINRKQKAPKLSIEERMAAIFDKPTKPLGPSELQPLA